MVRLTHTANVRKTTASIIRAVPGFGDQWSDEIPAGCPLIFDDDMNLLVEPTRFCREYLFTYSGSMGTALKYAYCLRDFSTYLNRFGADWTEADRDHILGYRRTLQKKGLSNDTINTSITILRQFYGWLVDAHGIDESPFPSIARGRRDPLKLAPAQRSPREIPSKAYEAILSQMSPKYRLCAVIAACTGLRAHEVAGLLVEDFPSHIEEEFHEVKVRGKGGKVRSVPFPLLLVDDIRNFIEVERRAIIADSKARDPRFREPSEILLATRGHALAERRLGVEFRKARIRAGFSAKRHYVFHALRNNFGNTIHDIFLNENEARAATGEDLIDVLTAVRSAMRHAKIETTEGYLRTTGFERKRMQGILAKIYEKWAGTQTSLT